MNRRRALSGAAAAAVALAFPLAPKRGSAAAAQSGSGDRMGKWAYSTEGFERIVHRIEGVETVTYANGPTGGRGQPLVYFHGGGTFHGFEWARALADEFTIYCPYHPHFGESGPDVFADAPFDEMADYVAHYELLFPALGLDTFHLAGASMGGHMAARYAAANPGDVDKLVLNAPAGLVSSHASMPDLSQVAPQDLPPLFVTDPAWIEPFWPAEPSPEWLALREREAAAALAARENPAATDRALREGLAGFDRPTLLLWGEADRIVPPGFAREWQELLPHARLEVIARGSHLLLDEFPEAVEALRVFLQE